VFLRAASRDGSRSDPKLEAALNFTDEPVLGIDTIDVTT
jgi:hypothetical protein